MELIIVNTKTPSEASGHATADPELEATAQAQRDSDNQRQKQNDEKIVVKKDIAPFVVPANDILKTCIFFLAVEDNLRSLAVKAPSPKGGSEIGSESAKPVVDRNNGNRKGTCPKAKSCGG